MPEDEGSESMEVALRQNALMRMMRQGFESSRGKVFFERNETSEEAADGFRSQTGMLLKGCWSPDADALPPQGRRCLVAF